MSERQHYYFTFMHRQQRLKDAFVKVYGTFAEARKAMFESFGDQWAFQYTEREFLPQIERFGLSEIELPQKEDQDEES